MNLSETTIALIITTSLMIPIIVAAIAAWTLLYPTGMIAARIDSRPTLKLVLFVIGSVGGVIRIIVQYWETQKLHGWQLTISWMNVAFYTLLAIAIIVCTVRIIINFTSKRRERA